MGVVTGKTFSSDLPGTPPSQVLAECYDAFERSAGIDVDFVRTDAGLVIELLTGDGPRELRPSEVFDLLDGRSSS